MDLSGIQETLGAIFLAISFRYGSHWEITEAEAKRLEQAMARVARHYSFASTQKMADWTQLMLAIGNVCSYRVMHNLFQPQQRSAPLGQQAPAQPSAAPAPSAPPSVITPGMLDPGAMSVSHATSGAMI